MCSGLIVVEEGREVMKEREEKRHCGGKGMGMGGWWVEWDEMGVEYVGWLIYR
jgi:hypothetical protein